MTRVAWHQSAAAIRREFARWFESPASAWQLPPTATEEDRLLSSSGEPLPQGNGLIAVWTRLPEMAALYSDACRVAGYVTAWLHPRRPARLQGAVAAIFDGSSLDASGIAELRQLAAHVLPAPVVAMLDAPRTQDVRAAKALGVFVMARPFRIDELHALIHGVSSC